MGTINEPIREGEFRFAELKTYLQERSLPMAVWISEDGTRITCRVQYNSRFNQVVGFVLPFDDNGLPIVGTFAATSSEKIREYFQSGRIANYVYVIIAQSLQEGVPAFCFSFFGSDNRFTAIDVIRRWKWMQMQATLHGITLVEFSSDGDTRLLQAMKYKAISHSLDILTDWQDWFVESLNQSEIYVQDTTHIGTKLRKVFLKPSVLLPLGNYVASATYLRILIDNISQQEHGLTKSDLSCKDKMNFRAVEKMCESRVIDNLYNIVSTEGTVIYLQIIKRILDSYLDKDIAPVERIQLIWTSVFFSYLATMACDQQLCTTKKFSLLVILTTA